MTGHNSIHAKKKEEKINRGVSEYFIFVIHSV